MTVKNLAKPIPNRPDRGVVTHERVGRPARLALGVMLMGLLVGCAPSHKYLTGSDSKDAFKLLVHCEHAQALAKAEAAAQSADEKTKRSGLIMQILIYEDETDLTKTPELLDQIMALPGTEESREDVIDDMTELFDDMRARRDSDTGQTLCP